MRWGEIRIADLASCLESALGVKMSSLKRLRGIVRMFESLVRMAGYPAEDWRLAINGALLRKLQRHVHGHGVPITTRIKLGVRFGLCPALNEAVARIDMKSGI